MHDFIRVRNKHTGSEYTVSADIELGDDVEQVDKPATSSDGKPLPEKHKTDLAGEPVVPPAPPAVGSGSEPPTQNPSASKGPKDKE